jgi:hypothetical protein
MPRPTEHDQRVFTVYTGIIESLKSLVGQKITPELLETIEEVCASHVREQGYDFQGIPKVLEKMRRRMELNA